MKVYLVGAGPGDPGLLTLKGRKVLERADVILYDHLASDRLLEFAPAKAQHIYVGKKRADHECTMDEITALMIDHARLGKTVVRLKGGDPFIFGRGGEEVEALAAAGIPFEIVPGVTTPLGVAAYTGVPLTHREHTSAVTFVTGMVPTRILLACSIFVPRPAPSGASTRSAGVFPFANRLSVKATHSLVLR